MAAPYLTPAEAVARLSNRFGLSGYTLLAAHVEVASDEVDASGPFVGGRYDPAQERAFPRETASVPGAVLDLVALRAAMLSRTPEPSISSKSVGGISVTYAKPKRTQLEVLASAAYGSLTQYRRRTGVMT